MTAWFRGLSRREQRLILIMLALAALVLAWLLVVRPLSDALAEAKARHAAAAVELAEARGAAAEIARLELQGGGAAAGPLDGLLSRSAAEAGFQVARIQPSGDGVAVAMDAARPQAFFAWVAQMEAQGLVVARLNARANADRTIAAEATFRKRGG